ncbi:MAG TPA: hypothetical protein VN018_02590 [Brevundimonas sp.]|nr:hypothetical protein [Brevundimonas sp.]
MLPEQARLMSAVGAPRWSIFFLLQAKSGPVRAWLGIGDHDVPADDVDLTGGTYLGIGLVGDVPALRQLVGATAERVEFVLSGADDLTLALADEDAEDVRGAQVQVGIIFYDADWQPVAPVAWYWEGTADVPSIDRNATEGDITRVISLSVGSAFTDRTRPTLGFYTPQDQRRRSATDAFCDRVPALSAESTIQWPGP